MFIGRAVSRERRSFLKGKRAVGCLAVVYRQILLLEEPVQEFFSEADSSKGYGVMD